MKLNTEDNKLFTRTSSPNMTNHIAVTASWWCSLPGLLFLHHLSFLCKLLASSAC
jgi:hypothetical protein